MVILPKDATVATSATLRFLRQLFCWWRSITLNYNNQFTGFLVPGLIPGDRCQKSGEDWGEEIRTSLIEEVKKPEIQKLLPWLNETPLHKLVPNQIVKFRGMIQDIFEQEYYLDTYEVRKLDGTSFLKPGRYLDVAHCPVGEQIIHSEKCETADRMPYYCISLPGENTWVKEMYADLNLNYEKDLLNTDHNKRHLGEDACESNSISRQNSENDAMCGSDRKRLKESNRDNANETKPSLTSLDELNFPFPHTNGMACIVKINEDLGLKLNSIIEVVGILSIDPSMASDLNDLEESWFTEDREVLSPPPSLVPRLHALTVMEYSHCNPLLTSTLTASDIPDQRQSARMREVLGAILDVALLGDELATEYILCNMTSSVYMRQGILPLGNFTLNLSGITQELQDKDYPTLLYGLLQSLTTHSYYLPLSLETMNQSTFIPKKDYDSNHLKSGVLQLPSHLYLVLDETHLTAGQLDVVGLKNLTALGNLVNWQKVDYDFQFHSIEQHTNVPVLIFSEGKSLITSNYQVKLDYKHTDVTLAFSKVASMLEDRKVVNQLRAHLTYSKQASYSLPDNIKLKIEEDFVQSRKHEDGMTADDLHSLLTLAKLLAQGLGKAELTNEIWRSAKMLEAERKQRLRKV